MDWRESFLRFCGPGLLGGITFGQWCALWRRRDLQFDLSRAPRMLSITSQSVKNSVLKRVERARFQKLIDQVEIVPPLFILGHWRNGTTLLHHLLTRDERFGFPNGYQVSIPPYVPDSGSGGHEMASVFHPSPPSDGQHANGFGRPAGG